MSMSTPTPRRVQILHLAAALATLALFVILARLNISWSDYIAEPAILVILVVLLVVPAISQVAKLIVLSTPTFRADRPPLAVFGSAAILELFVWGLIGGVNPTWEIVDTLGHSWLTLIRLPLLLLFGLVINWAAFSTSVKEVPGSVRPELVLVTFTVLPLVLLLVFGRFATWLVGTF